MFPHKLAFSSWYHRSAKINLTEQATFYILGSSASKLIRLCPSVNYIFGITIFRKHWKIPPALHKLVSLCSEQKMVITEQV